ncbi:hypothetical protein DAEQUDRAFT_600045 [Daedalea quercina L-15889]|uniref:PAS domain-containing protein n=1 Tax=Daedalea quercina L-15889 TaxID=1314783 RepID=A0A165LNK3_9APHY|nr:hypothetical protein DAEQUDRAFT_600045 [Daedalea quercina L-15889]
MSAYGPNGTRLFSIQEHAHAPSSRLLLLLLLPIVFPPQLLMPFRQYLDDDNAYPPDYHVPPAGPPDPHDPSIFSSNVQFQVPGVITGAPTLVPGGGAEALPQGYLPPSAATSNPLTASWWSDSPYDRYPSDFASNAPSPKYHHHDAYHQHPHLYHPSPLIPSQPDPHSSYAPTRLVQTPVSATRSPYLDGPSSLPVSISAVPTSLGLPVYSTSGFDFLSLLSRIANRTDPKIHLGPVDMSCSFVVVDARRYDFPVVYASPSFCRLTGYSEQEVLGRNCRFLQAPDGRVQRGEHRRHTAPEAVHALKSACISHKECQTSIINYCKGGRAFINLVTIIPVSADDQDEVAYYVGFQVDLAEQPSAILQKLRDGSYMVDYSRRAPFSAPSAPVQRNWRTASAAMTGASNELHNLLSDSSFLDGFASALPGSAGSGTMPSGGASPPSTNAATASPANDQPADPYDGNKPLNLLLLAASPDFVHVVSLKGVFLYVAPSVRDVLGYEPAELVGRSLAEFCHRADVVPLTRELKDSSVTPGSGMPAAPTPRPEGRRKVDLLFRIRTKRGELVWLECRGRLHAEPGKARKAIILSGRVRSMPQLDWGPIARAGGLAPATTLVKRDAEGGGGGDETRIEEQHEFWGLVGTGGTWLFAGHAVADVLGWGATEVIGRMVSDFIGGAAPAEAQRALSEALDRVSGRAGPAGGEPSGQESRAVNCDMKRKDGTQLLVRVTFYRPPDNGASWPDIPIAGSSRSPPPRPVVCQVRQLNVDGIDLTPGMGSRLVHPRHDSVFDELGARRESSWQYELQQLKFENERLREEVESLEGAVDGALHQHQRQQRQEQEHIQATSISTAVAAPVPMSYSLPQVMSMPPLSRRSEVPPAYAGHAPVDHHTQGWRPTYSYHSIASHHRMISPTMHTSSGQQPFRLPMKRPWDGSADDGPT